MLIPTLKLIKFVCHCKLLALINVAKSVLLSGLVLMIGENQWLIGLAAGTVALESGPKQVLAEDFGWKLEGDWTASEESVLLTAAEGIEQYVERTAEVDGRQWMEAYVGELTFYRGAWLTKVFDANLSLPGGHILVLEGFGGSVEPYTDMVHEVAHVIDNNQGGQLPATLVGGGPADEMVADVGGDPELCRPRILCPEDYGPRVGGADMWPDGVYATTGVAEDFAETFAYAAFFPERVPPARLAWMGGWLRETAVQIEMR